MFIACDLDKSWINLRNRISFEYTTGLEKLLQFAFTNKPPEGNQISCPCKKCACRYYEDKCTVREHCIVHGFDKGYTKWTSHGEYYDGVRDYQNPSLLDDDNLRIDMGVRDNMKQKIEENLRVINEQRRSIDEVVQSLSVLKKHDPLNDIIQLPPEKKRQCLEEREEKIVENFGKDGDGHMGHGRCLEPSSNKSLATLKGELEEKFELQKQQIDEYFERQFQVEWEAVKLEIEAEMSRLMEAETSKQQMEAEASKRRIEAATSKRRIEAEMSRRRMEVETSKQRMKAIPQQMKPFISQRIESFKNEFRSQLRSRIVGFNQQSSLGDNGDNDIS